MERSLSSCAACASCPGHGAQHILCGWFVPRQAGGESRGALSRLQECKKSALRTKHNTYCDRTGKKKILWRHAQKCFLSCNMYCTIARTRISFCGQKQSLQPLRPPVVADPPWLMLSCQASNQTVMLATAQLEMYQLKRRWTLPRVMMFSFSLDLLPRK